MTKLYKIGASHVDFSIMDLPPKQPAHTIETQKIQNK